MKKAEQETADELRPEYKWSDFGKIVRGKYASKIKEESNVVLLEPDVAQSSVRLKKYSGGAAG